MPSACRARRWLLTILLLASGTLAVPAQGHGPDGPGMGPPPGPNFGNRPPDGMHHGGPPPGEGMHRGLRLGPPGRWWDDKQFSQDLGLSSEQQKRMDAIFAENRSVLVARFQALHEEESRMEALSRANGTDEAALFAQIDRLTQAHAALEKADAHMLLRIRHEMSADQIARLESHR